MAKFLFAYSGGNGMSADEAERQKQMEKWGAWMGGLGAALVDPGAPFGEAKLVDGGSSAGLTGYSVYEAGSLDDAVAAAQDCPIFDSGGHVEVYEALPM
jgi:hypothetical protein